MEQGEKKLVEERERIRRQRIRLDRRMAAIDEALGIMGTRVAEDSMFQKLEAKYGDERPFREMTLVEACLAVLTDYADNWLDKRNVEYLLELGGYDSDAEAPTNSVEVTLRRLAVDKKCEVQKLGGQNANRYRAQTKQQWYLNEARLSMRDGNVQDAKEKMRVAERIGSKGRGNDVTEPGTTKMTPGER